MVFLHINAEASGRIFCAAVETGAVGKYDNRGWVAGGTHGTGLIEWMLLRWDVFTRVVMRFLHYAPQNTRMYGSTIRWVTHHAKICSEEVRTAICKLIAHAVSKDCSVAFHKARLS